MPLWAIRSVHVYNIRVMLTYKVVVASSQQGEDSSKRLLTWLAECTVGLDIQLALRLSDNKGIAQLPSLVCYYLDLMTVHF